MTETDAIVFVVDDDAPMRQSLQNLIGSVGLRVEAFASAQEFMRADSFLQQMSFSKASLLKRSSVGWLRLSRRGAPG